MNPTVPLEVLFEDNHLIVVNKLPSQIVQGDKTGDVPLSKIVADHLKEKYHKPGDAFIGVIHRIDRPVSGILILAKTSKGLSKMNELFREHQVQKTYWAVVKNKPKDDEGTLVHYLIKNEKKNMSRGTLDEKKGSLRSELKYKLLASSDTYHLLEVKPLTGRHHQIRVQLSCMGSPIKGDLKYGFDRSNKDASIHLHARQIDFIHPVTKEKISIKADPPKEVVWNALRLKLLK